MAADAYIRLDNVSKVYQSKAGPVEACGQINLDIRESEFVAIVGPSGCGKTTILKMVAGLQPRSSGTITVGGRVVDRPQTDLGIVFQDAILLDWRNVLDNVLLQVDIRKLDRARYEPVIRQGWSALVRAVQPNGMLGWVQRIGDQPGHTAATGTEIYGAGAFLLAGSEVHRLASK